MGSPTDCGPLTTLRRLERLPPNCPPYGEANPRPRRVAPGEYPITRL
jgi:hypothetical protein